MIYIQESDHCCALSEIGGIAGYDGQNVRLLKDFCLRTIPYCNWSKDHSDNLSALYLFTGVEKVDEDGLNDDEWNDDYDPVDYVGYGSELAKYIKDNKLGVVVASPTRINRLHHPTHHVKAWLWAPDHKNLLAWYKANK